jgi:hypothetical protein
VTSFAAMSLLVAATLAGPAGCFLVVPGLLALPVVLPVAGTARWGWKWLLRLLAAVAAPGIAAAVFAAAGKPASAIASLRWAMSLCCGAYMASDAGMGPLAWWFAEAGKRLGRIGLGRIGAPLGQIALTLGLAQPLIGEFRRLSAEAGGGERGIRRFLRIADQALDRIPAEPPNAGPPRVGGIRIAVASALWLYCMTGLAGL